MFIDDICNGKRINVHTSPPIPGNTISSTRFLCLSVVLRVVIMMFSILISPENDFIRNIVVLFN